MAAKLSATRGLALFVKRFVDKASTRDLPAASLSSPTAGFSRNIHVSDYDKNEDEHVRPVVVPDNIVEQQSDKYWAPNPQTGVFGPASEANSVDRSPADANSVDSSSADAAESVLEQKAFFRPLEDLEKPEHP